MNSEPVGEAPRFRSILIYGPPGTYKTLAMCRMFEKLKKNVIDVDQKLGATLAGQSFDISRITTWRPEARLSGKHIGIVRIQRMEKDKPVPGTEGYVPQDPQGYLEIVKYVDSLSDMADAGAFPFDVTAIDTLTGVSEHLTNLIKFHHKAPTFSLPLWGVYKENMLEFIKAFLALPCHRLVLCHDNTREDEDTNEVRVRPSILGSFRDEIAKEFTEVYYFQGKLQGKFMAYVSANKRYVARTANPKLIAANELPVEDLIAANQ